MRTAALALLLTAAAGCVSTRPFTDPEGRVLPETLAKAMSVVQAAAYRAQHGFNAVALVPGNLYGPHDNFDLRNSHVIPALIRRFLANRGAARRH